MAVSLLKLTKQINDCSRTKNQKKTSFETEKMVSGRKVVFLFYLSFFVFLVSLRGCLFFGFGSQKKLMERVVFSSKSIIAPRIFSHVLRSKTIFSHVFFWFFILASSWVNYLITTSLRPHRITGQGNHPKIAASFRLVKYVNLPRIMVMVIWGFPTIGVHPNHPC